MAEASYITDQPQEGEVSFQKFPEASDLTEALQAAPWPSHTLSPVSPTWKGHLSGAARCWPGMFLEQPFLSADCREIPGLWPPTERFGSTGKPDGQLTALCVCTKGFSSDVTVPPREGLGHRWPQAGLQGDSGRECQEAWAGIHGVGWGEVVLAVVGLLPWQAASGCSGSWLLCLGRASPGG